MAATAETLTPNYLSADAIPGIAELRQVVREDAWALVAHRQTQLEQGECGDMPLQIDALSTANHVLEAEPNSTEYHERFAGLQLDCRRIVAEWFRKNRPEYFPASRHFFDANTGDFYSHGLSIRQMTENALRPIDDDPEEVARRVNERVEDATPNIIRKVGGLALNSLGIRTVSECSDKAITDYQAGDKKGYNGYVPEIEKLMVRDIRVDTETGDRFEEQIGLPGLYINHYVIQEALRHRGIVATIDKTQLHGTQLLVEDDLIDFVRLLDEVASEEWRTTIFMGEAVAPDHPRNYEQIREEAMERQAQLENQARTVALFVMSLAENETDPRKAPEIVETFVKKMLLQMAKDDRQLAMQMFDEKTADGLQQVAYLEAKGQTEDALRLFNLVEETAPGGGYCGAGSCGLESIEFGSDEERLVKDALGFGDSKDVIKDTERKCKCGAKTVYYDLKQGKKGCTTCHKTAKY